MFTDAQHQAVEGMKPFFGCRPAILFIATTGYTGEAGLRKSPNTRNEQAADFWRGLLDWREHRCQSGALAIPCVTEAGMNLYV